MNDDYKAAKERRKDLIELIAAAADEIAVIDTELPNLQNETAG